MDQRNTPGNGDVDWNDPMFNTAFDDSMNDVVEFDIDRFTNHSTYLDEHGINMRTSSKAGFDPPTVTGAQQAPAGIPVGASTESSSQDSASDTSSRRKRKVTESPGSVSAQATETGVKLEDEMDMAGAPNMHPYNQAPVQRMDDLSLEHALDGMAPFEFVGNSNAASPEQNRDFGMPVSMAQMHVPMAHTYQPSPQQQTINPGMFQLGSEDPNGALDATAMFNNASPNAVFSTPSSDSNETFNANPAWNNGMVQNPTWPQEFGNQFASPGGLAFTPSPRVNGATPPATTRAAPSTLGRSPLHIAPIAAKSRVETQINIVMTLETPPPGLEHLHLPLHTIAKSKLLAKDEYERSKSLELHTMLVCTSAMHNKQLNERALRKAALQNNDEIQRRAEIARESGDDDRNDARNVEDAEKPANGGEVRICPNCIQRERKRAARKKLKKEEEQQHWERYETERVVVFNSQEYLAFKPWEKPQQDNLLEDPPYVPPEGAVQVAAAMRIACYCRHQNEKEGFKVIFTLKDQIGNVVAQQMSDSILITDDHKTHPPSYSATMPGEYDGSYAAFGGGSNGLPSSQSMVNLYQPGLPNFPSSRSTGNLQAMQYGQMYNSHSHVHQVPNSGYTSQATSATMTPTSLSRPGSPTNAGHSGPNKKRKASGGAHRRLPSGLTMTRVDTSQPPSATMPSAMSLTSPFSPSADYAQSQQYMTIPANGGPAQFFGSAPPTPSETQQPFFTQATLDQQFARSQQAQAQQAYFSHPSSAVPSRSSSPVLTQSRANMNAYARHPIQTPTNTMQARQAPYQQQQAQQLLQQQQQQMVQAGGGAEPETSSLPAITRMVPSEGPVRGGTEVSIFGYNFPNGMTVMFGDKAAASTFYGPQCVLATAPPSRPGGVNVTLIPPNGQQSTQYVPQQISRQIFTYKDILDPKTTEMALKYYSQQQSGNPAQWMQYGQQAAQQFQQSSYNVRDQGGYGQGPGNNG
ncbi:SPT3 Dosage dependent suppressor of Ty-induced promoter mutations-like protein [Recurvomyces mirabilis]|nr:SPT3 Dosage dependent suppressor of Ty-induced promoter mutations-like protein [Recurvomyces mirabilis]